VPTYYGKAEKKRAMEFTPFRAYIYPNGALGLHFIDPTGYWAHKRRITITGDPRINGDYRIGTPGQSAGVNYYGSPGSTPHTVMVSTRQGTFTHAQAIAFNLPISPYPDSAPSSWGYPTEIGLSGIRATGRGNNPQPPIGTWTEVVNGEIQTTMDIDRVPSGVIQEPMSFCEAYPAHPACNPVTGGLTGNGNSTSTICAIKPNHSSCSGGGGGGNADRPVVDYGTALTSGPMADNRIRAAIVLALLAGAYLLWKD
jgi:hypothetical protein